MDDEKYWMTVEDLIHITKRSRSTVYSWASKFGWESNKRRPVKYRTSDVVKSLGKAA